MKKEKNFSPIHRKRGWGLFLFGLGISLIFGLTVRSLFSSRSLEYWVDERLETEGLRSRLLVEGVHLDLRSSTLPRLALRMDRVQYKDSGPCPKFRISFNNVYLPIRFSTLFDKTVALKTVRVGDSELLLNPECSDAVVKLEKEISLKPKTFDIQRKISSVSKKGPKDLQKSLMEAANYFQKRWSDDWQKAKRVVNGFEIERLVVFDAKTQKRWATFSTLSAEFEKDQKIAIDGGVRFDEFLLVGGSLRPFTFTLESDANMAQFKTKGLFQEGRFNIDWKFDWQGQMQEVSLSTKDFPLRAVAFLLSEGSDRQFPLDLRRVWLSCRAHHKSALTVVLQEVVRLRDCEIYGNGGKLTTTAIQVKWDDKVVVEPFKVTFDGVSLEHFVNVVGKASPMGVFNSLGRIYGSLNVKSAEEVEGYFDLKDLQLAFSNQGNHGRQDIEQVRLEVNYSQNRISGLISRMQFEEGDFSGTMSFNLDSALKEGAVQVKVKEASFSPSIQKLLVDGTLSPLELYGQAKIEDGEVTQWKGTLGVKEVRGESWGLDRFKLSSDWVDRTIFGDLRVQKIYFKDDHRITPIIRSLMLKKELENGESAWTELRARVQMDDVRGSWTQFSVVNENDKSIKLTSKGKWLRDKEINGLVKVQSKSYPSLDWSIVGGWKSLQAFPEPKSLKKIIATNQRRKDKSLLSEKWFEKMVKDAKERAALENSQSPQLNQ